MALQGKTLNTVTDSESENEKAKKVGKNNKTNSGDSTDNSEEPTMGENIIKYFKNILNDFNKASRRESDVSKDGEFIGQVSQEVPTTNEETDEEDEDDEESAPGKDDVQTTEQKAEKISEHTAKQTTEQSDSPQGGLNEGDAKSTHPVQGENDSESGPKYSEKVYEDILISLNKRGGEQGTNENHKYNEFKKEYDMFISLNKDEYEIIEKLVDAFCVNNQPFDEDADSVYEAIKKSFTDPKFKKEFGDFINGIYDYSQKKHNIRGTQTEQTKTYHMLFQNVINFLNMI